jgi:long-chain acyl-CoA synthetase
MSVSHHLPASMPDRSNDFGFAYFAKQNPSAVAIIDVTGEEWSRARLLGLVTRLAMSFESAGLDERAVVAIISPNCAEYIAVYFAAIRAGLYVVPVNWHLSVDEITYILVNSGAKAIVVNGRLSPTVLAKLAALARTQGATALAIGHAAGFADLDSFQKDVPTTDSVSGRSNGRIMAYTSATTGKPKGVQLPTSNAQRALERTVASYQSMGIRLEGNNVHLCSSMLYHAAPLQSAVTALEMGHRLVLAGRWQPDVLLELIERHRVTTTFMVPATFVRLLKMPNEVRRKYVTASLRYVAHAGAPCPISIKREMLRWWGPIIWESYGATEGQGTIASSEDWLKYPGTVGRPFAGSRFQILDESGAELPAGEAGAIYFTPHTGDRFEYRGDPEATRTCYRGDFITVGDIGYMNEEGYLFICDRRTDVVISSGMNIYPAEIEEVLVQHPAVVDCGVYGVPHEIFGAVPCAAVQVRPGVVGNADLTLTIFRFLQERLSSMKLPKHLHYVDSIPRDPNGKLYRRLLRGAGESGSNNQDR